MNRRTFGQLVAGAAAAQTLSHSMAFAAPVATPASGFHFSVMLWTLTKALTVDQALEVVAAAGFKGVELVGEYKKWSPEDSRRIKASLSRLGLTIDSNAPGRVNLPDPSAWPAINDLITTAIPITRDLGCSQIILTSGNRVPTVTPEVEHQAIIDNLKRIADIATKENFEIVLEPIDLLENKNSYVTSVTDGFEIVRAVGSPNVKVLYDFYHEQRGAGNVIEKLDKNIDLVGLVHIADVPGRHEPGSGEMNYTNIYRKLASLKYNRFIAMEFYPTGDPTTQLKAARLAAIEAEHSV